MRPTDRPPPNTVSDSNVSAETPTAFAKWKSAVSRSTSSESSPTTSLALSAAISPADDEDDGGDQRPAPATRRPQT